eukprot:120781-Prorocentrum_minimum.AAC.1
MGGGVIPIPRPMPMDCSACCTSGWGSAPPKPPEGKPRDWSLNSTTSMLCLMRTPCSAACAAVASCTEL